MILSILLSILKIIGIIIAVILGVIILLILLLLFVPIRYSAKGVRTGEDSDPPVMAEIKVSWLLHFIHASGGYFGSPEVCVRVLGIPVFRLPKKELTDKQKAALKEKEEKKARRAAKKAEKQAKKAQGKSQMEETVSGPEEQPSETCDISSEEEFSDTTETSPEAENGSENSEHSEDNEDASYDETDASEQLSIFDRIRNIIKSAIYTIKNIYAKIKSLKDNTVNKTVSLKKNIHYYYRILTSDLFKRTYEKVKVRLGRLLKSILPRKLEIGAELGFDDPYVTGEAMAIAGMLYPIVGENVHIKGNFEENVIRAAFIFKGKIRLFSFVKLGIFYLTDRDLKKLIKLFKKEVHKNGRKQ